MLGGWGGLLSSTARGPSGPFCFSSAGVDVFRLHCICDASIFVAFVSYCSVHATRRRFVAFVSYCNVHATRRFS